ncbi:MAG TPA: hypothetical protein VFZ36_05950 [Vicinamibacterales bacterium]
MKLRSLTLACAAAALVSAPASAQSLFSTRGLGVPLPAVDARARALGGIGVGLIGLNTSLVNPAEMAGISRRGVSAALQPSFGSVDVAEAEGDASASRFPMIRIMYPISSRFVFSLGYGGVLEQSWAIATEGDEQIGDQVVDTRDVVRSTGGVAQVTASLSYAVSPTLAVGLGGGMYTGSLLRQITRTFTESEVPLSTFQTRLRWEYSGPSAVLGVVWDPDAAVRIGGALTVADELEITAKEGVAQNETVKLPLRATFGASAFLSPDLIATAGAEWSGRGSGDQALFASGNTLRRNTWRAGGGLEYQGVTTPSRTFPIRLGGSYTQLPFFEQGEEPGNEWSAAFGIGFRLASDQTGPTAVADVGVERGGRTGLVSAALPDGLSESFWRLTFSLSLFGR